MKKIKTNKGSIALISILVVSAVVLILAVGGVERHILTSHQYYNNYSNNIVYYSAEGCLEETMRRIEEDTSFAGTTLNIDDTVCTVTVQSGNPIDINISVSYQDYLQNYHAQVILTTNGQANNAELSNWEEI